MYSKFIPLIILVGLFLTGCEVQKTQDAKMPEVNVDVTEGQAPKYEVTPPKVDVGTTTTEVKVPQVDVTTETKQVEVPKVEVTPASEADKK